MLKVGSTWVIENIGSNHSFGVAKVSNDDLKIQ